MRDYREEILPVLYGQRTRGSELRHDDNGIRRILAVTFSRCGLDPDHETWLKIFELCTWAKSFEAWKATNIGFHPFASTPNRNLPNYLDSRDGLETWDLNTIAALAYKHFDTLGEKRWYEEVYPVLGFPDASNIRATLDVSTCDGRTRKAWRVTVGEGTPTLVIVPPEENAKPARALNRWLMGGGYWLPTRRCFYGYRQHLIIQINGERVSMTRLGTRKQRS
jgi:hypothetical protein